MSALAIAKAVRDGETSAEQLVDACLSRIEEVNPGLNAVVQLDADRARAAARAADAARDRGERLGPLHGVPVTVKDAIDVAGLVGATGTLGRAAHVPDRDAPVVARLRAAGAIVLGKTNVPELCLAAETDNLVYGRTSNPYDLSRTAGGSSGGEAAIVAAGGSALGIGSDAGGSVRIPAHYCGLAGLKPTPRRVPRSGHFPPALGLFEPVLSIGALARDVEDLAVALRVLEGPWAEDPEVPPPPPPGEADTRSLRICFYVDNGVEPPTADTVRAVRSAAAALEGDVALVEEATPPGSAEAYGLYFGILAADGGEGLRALLEAIGTTRCHPMLERAFELTEGAACGAGELADRIARAHVLGRQASVFMERYDAVISPVCSGPAPPHGASLEFGGVPASISYSSPAGLFGWPAVAVRAGATEDGLPIGVQVAARPWRDHVALAVAARIEAALGGWRPAPR